MEPDPVLQAVALFGARVRGHGSDFDTPALRAWLAEQAASDGPGATAADDPRWRSRARALDRRLPVPVRRVGRRVLRRLRSTRS